MGEAVLVDVPPVLTPVLAPAPPVVEVKKFVAEIRPLSLDDLPFVEKILNEWVVTYDTDQPNLKEIDGYLENMLGSINGRNKRTYFVAVEKDEVIGVIGMTEPTEAMRQFVVGKDKTVEWINIYVTHAKTGQGVGTALRKRLEEESMNQGYKYAIFKSSFRFKDAWKKFHDKIPGSTRIGRVGGVGGYAQVWRKQLIKTL